MHIAKKFHCDFSLFKSKQSTNIQLTIDMDTKSETESEGYNLFKLIGLSKIKSQMLYQLS